MFRVGPAIQAMFELGYEPKEAFFYELTQEQYLQLEEEGNDLSKRWFTLIPDNPKFNVPELLVIDEDDKAMLIEAVQYINSLCEKAEGVTFSSFEDKLKYTARILPKVFTQSSVYEKEYKKSHLRVVK
jgi:hypothetical protein